MGVYSYFCSMQKLYFLVLTMIPIIVSAQSAEEQFDLGFEYYDAGEYEKAIDAYSLAIVAEPDNAKYYYHRGVCLSLISDNEKAIEDLTQAINLDDTFAEAYFERAFSRYGLMQIDEAINDYDQSIALDPEYGPAYLNRGTVKFQIDDLDGACYDWRKAFNLGIEIANELLKEYCLSKS